MCVCVNTQANCQYIGRGGRGLVANSDGTQWPRTLPHLIARSLATVQKMDWKHTNFVPEAVFVTVGQNDFRDTKCVLRERERPRRTQEQGSVGCSCVRVCVCGGGVVCVAQPFFAPPDLACVGP